MSLQFVFDYLPIESGYHDVWGNFHSPSEPALRALLKAMGFDPEIDLQRQLEDWKKKRDSNSVYVLHGEERKVCLTGDLTSKKWTLVTEKGERFTGSINNGCINLPTSLEIGYHRLALSPQKTKMTIILCPEKAYLPECLKSNERRWGVSTQLYAVHSRGSEGVGDFEDLKTLCNFCKKEGGSFVGVNPLHALFPKSELGFSPYSPSSRRALNPLYIRLEQVPEFRPEDLKSREVLKRPGNQLLDYSVISEVKFNILQSCFSRLSGERAELFEKYKKSATAHVKNFAEFTAKKQVPGSDEPGFHLYCQWLAQEQLSSVVTEVPLEIGLYLDLAVGVNPEGAEVFEDRELFAVQASAGAPPDLLNVQGQVWGLSPYIPWVLQERAYEPFIQTLRFNMQFAGALRIDHIMALQRLFWVPSGFSGAEGIYVRYPLKDLIGIVCLESVRNKCLVIGEDLGTVPDEIRKEMSNSDILSYKVLYFMKHYNGDGSFMRPDEYPRVSLVATSTHDLPSLAGFWAGRDLEIRKQLNLFSQTCTYESELAERERDRMNLRNIFTPPHYPAISTSEDIPPERLLSLIHRYLAGSGSMLQTIQVEDLLLQIDQANLPGTVVEHPNWRRKLCRSLEEIILDENISTVLKEIFANSSRSTG